jgi:hypothetical protein
VDDGGPAGQAELDLTVTRIRRALSSGHLVAWARCDQTCRLTVRGRIRASVRGRHRGAAVHFAVRRFAPPGTQRLRIAVPRGLRRWIRRGSPPRRLRARLHFVALGADGQRDLVRTNVRLRTGRL